MITLTAMNLPISSRVWRATSPGPELCNGFSPVQHTSRLSLLLPSLKYINHMFTLSTKVTLMHGTHVQQHKAAQCARALSAGRCACAKHINPPRSQGEQKPWGHGQFNPLVHSTANCLGTEGLQSLCLMLFHIPLAPFDAGALLRGSS